MIPKLAKWKLVIDLIYLLNESEFLVPYYCAIVKLYYVRLLIKQVYTRRNKEGRFSVYKSVAIIDKIIEE